MTALPNCLLQVLLTYVRTLHLFPLNLAVNHQRAVALLHDLAERVRAERDCGHAPVQKYKHKPGRQGWER